MSEESDSTASMWSGEHSLSDESGVSHEQDRHDSVDTAAARDHSYLPGTSNPLFPPSLLERRREQQRSNNNNDDSSLQKLAILELEGVVLFPGCTLPLRLRDSPWVDYLGRKVDASRDLVAPNEEVRIGVVTRYHLRSAQVEEQRRRLSWMRTSFTMGSGERQALPLVAIVGLLQEEEEEEDEDEEKEDEEGEDEGEDEEDEIQDRREDVHLSANLVSTPESSEPYDRRYVDVLLDRMDAALDQIMEMLSTATRGPLLNVHDLLNVTRQIDEALNRVGEINVSIRQAVSSQKQAVERRDHQVSESLNNIARQYLSHLSRFREQKEVRDYIRVRLLQLQAMREQAGDRDLLIGRIGTMATISYTFDEESDILTVGASQSSRREARDELVVTALGTNRFRVISRVEGDDENDSWNRPFGANHMSRVRLYWVEELPDHREFPLPPIHVRSQRPSPLLTPLSDSDDTDQLYFHQQAQTIRKLSQVSSIPYIAYKNTWPWRLVWLIRTALDRIPGFEGLRKNLPSLHSHDSLLEPTSFSFWMTSNMSLKEEEKLNLLKMPSTVERLRFILARVLEQEQKETSVCCSRCHSRLSNASSMFSVGGAEGTTGAYVNEYGVIHQTITLREADESKLTYSGGPETRDSWFPGYSWTITYCQRCYSHLGWKFDVVRADATEDRPESFFGFCASSVTFVHKDKVL